ncbi:hypothetical protein NUW58_g56 [Xylaria curta]|uniref:Uncharacterized protein n=1 Tax=Xylaria curta TaxID=42375 RepID=A0ACC1PSP8_9PEZI|nr:hypothetical protein NUW58_g56 [Xylaria curta]
MRVSSSSIAILSQLLLPVLAADTAAWKSRNIYFALTDRVAKTDDSGSSACGNLGNYCGGTFKGLESKLDYISGMGFDAIWITPVVANSEGGYHGYWAQDLYSVNSNYGTADDLKSLVNAAHEKASDDSGIYVMVDVVANHMGMAKIADNKPEPLNQESSYHPACDINYSDQSSVEKCRIAGLPDLNTESPDIQKVFNDWISWLVKEYSFDGVRIDTVKHVNKEFWPGFSSAAGVYTIGEVFDGGVDYLAGYANLMSGLLNYAIYYPMNNFYQQKGSSQAIVDMHDRISSAFPDPSALGTFLDNHDNARWLNSKNDASLLKNALAYVILSRGIPIVYYGTEQGYAGGADPPTARISGEADSTPTPTFTRPSHDYLALGSPPVDLLPMTKPTCTWLTPHTPGVGPGVILLFSRRMVDLGRLVITVSTPKFPMASGTTLLAPDRTLRMEAERSVLVSPMASQSCYSLLEDIEVALID